MFPLLLADAAASTPDALHSLLGLVEQAAIGLLALAASAAAAKLSSFLSSHATTNAAFGAAARAFELAKSVVAHIDTKVRPQLVSALNDGVLSADERKALQDAAMAAFKEALGPDGLAEIKKALGLDGSSALDTYLSGQLERALAAFRGAQAASDVASPSSPSPAAVAAAVKALTAIAPAPAAATPAPRP